MIRVYYPKDEVERENRLRVMCDGDPMTANALWKTGQYEHVATFTHSDLNNAYKTMQNGVVTESWGLFPTQELQPVKGILTIKGELYGNRSAMVGDIFELNGKPFICAPVGFKEI